MVFAQAWNLAGLIYLIALLAFVALISLLPLLRQEKHIALFWNKLLLVLCFVNRMVFSHLFSMR
jgi:hypothetical protein